MKNNNNIEGVETTVEDIGKANSRKEAVVREDGTPYGD
jgi:tetrahydromethanopterin S-methyltransferase subunit F